MFASKQLECSKLGHVLVPTNFDQLCTALQISNVHVHDGCLVTKLADKLETRPRPFRYIALMSGHISSFRLVLRVWSS